MVFSVPTWRFVSVLKPQFAIGSVIALGIGLSGIGLSGIGLGIGLGGCSLILDFDAPLEAIDGGSTIDATIAADATSASDAAPTQICNALDRALEVGDNNNNDTRDDATPLNGDAMETISSILCTETNATPDVDFFRLLVGADITEDITISLSPTTGQDLGIRLRQANGTVLEQAADGLTTNEIKRFATNQTQLASGTYFLEVYSISSSSAKVEYSLGVVRVPNPP